jgi:5-methyltetrahydrofolate--homocysteine methyltransferase
MAGQQRRRRHSVFADEARVKPIATLHTLRQQLARREGRANVALADFIAPRASGLADYIGAFAVTAGIGEHVVTDRFKHANDDYSAILAKALADRLAEAAPSGCTSVCARNSGAMRPTKP